MSTDDIQNRALLAYESGRRQVALVRALAVTAALVGLSVVVRGPVSAVVAPLVFAIVFFSEWRGTSLGQGVRRGIVLGLVTWILPMSVLRPCCANMDPAAIVGPCCTMPGCCFAAGAAIGLVAAFLAPRGRGRADLGGPAGIAAGTLGVTALRCTGLFVGEAAGLLLGVAIATAMVSGARAALVRARA